MDQIELFKPLSDKDFKSVYLAAGCGCLTMIRRLVNEPKHSRKMRKLEEAHNTILKDMLPRLGPVSPAGRALFKDYVESINIVLLEIAKDPADNIHVLLNLAFYCMRQIKVRDKHFQRVADLFDLFDGAWKNKHNDKGGLAIFKRIDEEVHIIVGQRTAG